MCATTVFGASLAHLLPVIDPHRKRLTAWQTFVFSIIGFTWPVARRQTQLPLPLASCRNPSFA